MKDNKDIMIDSLMARIRELEASHDKQARTIEQLNINNYLLGQYVFVNRHELLNSFAVFAQDNYKECAYHYGYEDIEQQVVDMLKDLADGIDANNKHDYSDLFVVLGGLLISNKN